MKKIYYTILLIFIATTITYSSNNTFHIKNTSYKSDSVTAYLLALCNYYTYPDLLQVQDYKSSTELIDSLMFKFKAYGVDTCYYLENKLTSTNIVIFESDNSLIISFRGSENKGGLKNWYKDWMKTDLDATMTAVADWDSVYLHQGFVNAFFSIKDSLIEMLDSINQYHKKIYLTGHSLGGALAIVAATDFAINHIGFEAVYTYGSPRVGGTAFKDFYDCLAIPTFCYINENDMVTKLPPNKKFWTKEYCPCYDVSHCGQYQNIGTQYVIDEYYKIVSERQPNLFDGLKKYKLGSIQRHSIAEYCSRIFYIYFKHDKSLIEKLPQPPEIP
ncbi:MAG: lipase family protein [Chitinophagales bacterium]|nr:lipase family protein [Chitinophagales bacterium]